MKRRNRILSVAVIVIALAAVLIIGESNGDLAASFRAMLSIPKKYTLSCVFCVFAGILMQALGLSSALSTMGYRLPFYKMYIIALVGEFYSFITPGASGGQPVQVYRLHKNGVSVGDATSALVIQYVGYHSMLLAVDVALGVIYRAFVSLHVGANILFLVLGFVFNLCLVLGALMLSFYQKPIQWLLQRIIRLMERWKIGNPDQLREKFSSASESFYTGMRFIVRRRGELIRQTLAAVGRILCMASVFFFVCRGLGQTSANYGKLVTLGAMQYTSAGYTPLPGASGAQEGIFSLYFDKLLPGDLLLSGVLTWRFISYYLVLLVGGIAALKDN